jgi:hypothetical protein
LIRRAFRCSIRDALEPQDTAPQLTGDPVRRACALAGEGAMAKHDEGVLARWSRLKRAQAGRSEPPAPEEAPAGEPEAAVPDADGGSPEAAAAVRIEDLPDIESLTYESDFTVFMAKGVPKALRNQALKKLWRSDPVLANLDGLNDYDLDYRPSEIMALAARAAEDLARGTKWQTARDRDRAHEPPAAAPSGAAPPAQEPTAQEPTAQEPPMARSTLADGTPPDGPDPGPARRGGAS